MVGGFFLTEMGEYMTTWTKQNGSTIELNDETATIEKAVSLGWTTDKAKTDDAPIKPKRTRRTKAQMEEARG